MCRWFLESDPGFAAEFERVWLWDEWPGRWGPDRGIDLIAVRPDGRVAAVQAKNYGERHTVTKRDVDTFLSESNRVGIDERLLIASTDRLARSAQGVMRAQDKPVSTCLLSRLRLSSVTWPSGVEALVPAAPDRAQPREHQVAALAALERWARTDATRGQVVMACGTGKSLVAVWAADRLGARKVLVLVPTIALLRQTAREWCRNATVERRLLQVCSDTARLETEDAIRGDELSTIRTTDAAAVAQRLRDDDSLLVLCTYDSSPVVAEAMRQAPGVTFDLAMADEAHRCAGVATSSHKTILDEAAIRARRRLFFTATPTVYGTRDKTRAARRNVRVASMDNRALFGSVVHHLPFAEAIARGLLCPYQVAVIPIADDEVHRLIERRRFVTADGAHQLEAGSLATQIACARAMRRFGCRRVVAFHPSIRDSKRFSEHFPVANGLLGDEDRPAGPVWSSHVDGDSMLHAVRAQRMERFRADEPDEYRLLSNVRLLTEGVDVPGIDAIAFVDTHRGQAAVIQAVGRAVRPAPGKTVGTIVLPVVLRDGESFDAALARSEHRAVVDILGALRSHDPEIIKSLDDLRFGAGSSDQSSGGHGRFVVDAAMEVGEEFAAAVDVALTSALGVESERRRRSTASGAEPVVVARPQPPSEEETFLIGLNQLASLARWQILPRPPQGTGPFPMRAWWDEARRRWAADTLEEYDRRLIADSISWLALELDAGIRQRREMADLTEADLPEQIASQLRAEGFYAEGPLAPLVEDHEDPDELIEAITAIQAAVTHAAMSHPARLRYLLHALERLARALSEVTATLSPNAWELTSTREAAVDGFVHELAVARSGETAFEPGSEPWSARTAPEAHQIGRRGASPLVNLVRSLSLYRYPGDADEVEVRREDERTLTPDARLDALGWDIYLLTRARGATQHDGLTQAMDGTLRQRHAVRRDLLARSRRALAAAST